MEKKYLEVNGLKVVYHEDGEGYPLICIPAWIGSSLQFSKLPKLFEGEGIKVIRFDIPGWGGESEKISGERSFDRYMRLIADIVVRFGYKKYALLGYSLGSAFILHALSKRLIVPSKLILVSGVHSGENLISRESSLKRNIELLETVYRNRRIPYWLVKNILRLVHYQEIFTRRVFIRQLRYFVNIIHDSVKCDFSAAVEPLFTMSDISKKDLKNFRGKSLVIYNDKEPEYFKIFTKEIAHLLSVKPTVVYDLGGSGHRHFVFEPEISIDKIKKFLQKR